MKWLEAIHKISGKRVSSFKIMNDLEWQGKDKDEFIAPFESIENWEEIWAMGKKEVRLIFVHPFKRYENTANEEKVSAHFRTEEGNIARSSSWGESDEHKLAKKYIYENIDKISLINFEGKLIKDFEVIENIKMEKGIGPKRADVLVDFKKWHPIFGRGIAFEVQFSSQEEEKTIERSYDRASYGYSVVWLWNRELKNFNNFVRIVPYNHALKEYNDQITKKQDLELANIAEKAKRLTAEIRNEIEQRVLNNSLFLDEKNNDLKNFINSEDVNKIKIELKKILSEESIKLKEEYQIKKDFFKKEVEEKMKENFSKINLEEIEKIFETALSKRIESINLEDYVAKRRRICPNCGKNLHEYKNGDLSCEGCPYHRLNEKYYESQK